MKFLERIFGRGTAPKITTIQLPVSPFVTNDKISPSAIQNAIYEKQTGRLASIQVLYELLLDKEENLASAIDIRKEAVRSAAWVLPDDLSEQQKEYFDGVLTHIFPQLVDMAVDFKLFGILFKELVFEMDDSRWIIANIKGFRQLDLRIEDSKLSVYKDEVKLALSSDQFIMKHRQRAVLEPLLKYYVFKSFALNNWASFTETFGKPARIGKYAPGTTQVEQDTLWQMLQSLGTDQAAMISDTTAIEFLDHKAKSASSDLYEKLLKFCDTAVTKRILGQNLTTESQKSGSYAQAKVHELIRQDIIAGDVRDTAALVSEVLTMLNKYNFADDTITVKLELQKKVDLSARLNIDLALDKIIDIDAEYFYNTYGIPVPEGGEARKTVEPSGPF